MRLLMITIVSSGSLKAASKLGESISLLRGENERELIFDEAIPLNSEIPRFARDKLRNPSVNQLNAESCLFFFLLTNPHPS